MYVSYECATIIYFHIDTSYHKQVTTLFTISDQLCFDLTDVISVIVSLSWVGLGSIIYHTYRGDAVND